MLSGSGCTKVGLSTDAKLLPSLQVRGRVYIACVWATMLYGSKTWGTNDLDLQRIHRNDRAMLHWIYGVRAKDEVSSDIMFCNMVDLDPFDRGSWRSSKIQQTNVLPPFGVKDPGPGYCLDQPLCPRFSAL